jgi:putative hydrolase of the HAD superfamily
MRAVVFDLFNTLVPGGVHGDRVSANDETAAVLGVDAAAYNEAFFAASHERYVGAFGDLADTVRAIAARAGGTPSDEQVDRASALRRAMTADLLATIPDRTLSTLEALRLAGWRIALVSNVTSETPDRWRESKLPPYFDAVAFSSELRVAKPDPGIYLAACGQLDLPPAECVYVGDGADNELAGATALGMYAIRTTEHADSDPSWAGATISSLIDLPALLSALPASAAAADAAPPLPRPPADSAPPQSRAGAARTEEP